MDHPNAHRNHDLPSTGETLHSALVRSYRKRLFETLRRAVRNGSNGIDIVHLELQQRSNDCGLDVWQATEWETEPPTPPEDRGRRYDFRYYDRKKLLDCLSRGEWPD